MPAQRLNPIDLNQLLNLALKKRFFWGLVPPNYVQVFVSLLSSDIKKIAL